MGVVSIFKLDVRIFKLVNESALFFNTKESPKPNPSEYKVTFKPGGTITL